MRVLNLRRDGINQEPIPCLEGFPDWAVDRRSRVELSHHRRSCRADFIATATLDTTGPRRPVVGLDLREHQDPPNMA